MLSFNSAIYYKLSYKKNTVKVLMVVTERLKMCCILW